MLYIKVICSQTLQKFDIILEGIRQKLEDHSTGIIGYFTSDLHTIYIAHDDHLSMDFINLVGRIL